MSIVNKTHRFIAPDTKVYRAHAECVEAAFEEILAPYGITVRASSPGVVPASILQQMNVEGNIDGMIHPPQIEAFGNLLSVLVKPSTQNEGYHFTYEPTPVAISALTMSGKTGIINTGAFLSVAIMLLTGVHTLFQRLLTNDKGLEQQADESGQYFAYLYQHFEFEYNGQAISAYGYNDLLRMDLKSDVPVVGNGYRTSYSTIPEWKKQKETCAGFGIQLISFFDESDARCDADSVMSTIVEKHPEILTETFLGLSATNEAFRLYCKKLGFPCIDVLPEGVLHETDSRTPLVKPIYTGFPYLSGKKLKNLIEPMVWSLSEFDEAYGTNWNRNPNHFLTYRGWSKTFNTDRKLTRNDWLKAKSDWMCDFAKGVKKLLVKNNQLNGSGMIARIIVKNEVMQEFINELQSLLPEITIILHIPEEIKSSATKTLAKHIKKECGPEGNRTKPYLVIVTGKGRRGNVVPKDCKYGVDFAMKSSPNTLMQGITGRLTGYFKGIVLIILSQYNSDMLNHYGDTGRWEIPNKNGIMVRVSPQPRHIGQNTEQSLAISGYNIPKELREAIELKIKTCAKLVDDSKTKSGKKVSRMKVSGYLEWSHLLEPIAQMLEDDKEQIAINDDNPVKIMRYDGDTKIFDDGVAIRYAGNQSATNSNITESRTDPIIKDRDSQGQGRMQAVFIVDIDLNLMTIRLRLEETLCKHSLKKASLFGAQLEAQSQVTDV